MMKTGFFVIGFICVAIVLTGCESKTHNSHNTDIDVVSVDKKIHQMMNQKSLAVVQMMLVT